jgi:ABC-type sulfate/molybdate transport systems ATPase subunit
MLEAHIVKVRSAFTVEVEIRLERGERLGLFGASGAGKSTVLSCLAGLETPDAGAIRLAGAVLFPPNLPLYRRPLGYLTQNDWLFPHLSVAENVGFGLESRERAAAAGWIEELRQRLDLAPVWNEPARLVSGGQGRRVALARMLARRPPLILLDEPFTALDRLAISAMIEALMEWHRQLGFTLIAVDHRAEILERLCARAAVIESGRIVQKGSWPELASKPATLSLARLLRPI